MLVDAEQTRLSSFAAKANSFIDFIFSDTAPPRALPEWKPFLARDGLSSEGRSLDVVSISLLPGVSFAGCSPCSVLTVHKGKASGEEMA